MHCSRSSLAKISARPAVNRRCAQWGDCSFSHWTEKPWSELNILQSIAARCWLGSSIILLGCAALTGFLATSVTFDSSCVMKYWVRSYDMFCTHDATRTRSLLRRSHHDGDSVGVCITHQQDVVVNAHCPHFERKLSVIRPAKCLSLCLLSWEGNEEFWGLALFKDVILRRCFTSNWTFIVK